MAGQSSGSSSSTGTSTSTPKVLQSPQSEWGLLLSQGLWGLTQLQGAWAEQMQANGQPITDQAVAQFFQNSGMAQGLAGSILGRYKSVFQPVMDKYIQQAGSYNSEARQRFMMGQAESTAGQADQQAMDEIARQLQAQGINVNTGRMTSQMAAMRLADAAARAGAGTQASVNTAAIGRQMTSDIAHIGENKPGEIVNSLNSAYQGLNGAEQSMLGFINSLSNARNVGANFANAAGNANRLPPVGQDTQSQQQSRSNQQSTQMDPMRPSNSNDGNNSGRNNPGGNQGGNNTGTGSKYPMQPADNAAKGAQPRTDKYTNLPKDNVISDVDKMGLFGPDEQVPLPQPKPDFPNEGSWDPTAEGSSFNDRFGNWGDGGGTSGFDQAEQQVTDPFAGQGSGGYSNDGSFGQAEQQVTDPFAGGGQDQMQNDYQPPQDYPSADAFGGGGGDMSQNYDPWGGGGGGFYAKGGKVRPRGVLPTSGGAVPSGASPSRGQQTDDIPARLNAGEFVIPRDVAQHFGTKHFNDLIAKSRKLRTGMAGPPTGGKMKPALNQRPSFVSRGM